MEWSVSFAAEFEPDFADLPDDVQDALLARTRLLARFGPHLGRPHVDTLAGSEYANMKELRFDAASGVWRVAFAFDPRREAILLAAATSRGQAKSAFTSN